MGYAFNFSTCGKCRYILECELAPVWSRLGSAGGGQFKRRKYTSTVVNIMTLEHYLQHRVRYEILIMVLVLSLVLVVNVTTLGIEHVRDGIEPGWAEAWGSEFTSLFITGLLLPILFAALSRLDLSLVNIRWRVLGLLPMFVAYSCLHIAGFVLLREWLWAAVGDDYSYDPWLIGLVYEMRKDFLAFLLFVTVFYSYQFIINRLQGEARFLDREDEQERMAPSSQFLVKMLAREYLVKVDDIDWIQSASNYVILHCASRHYPMRQTLKGIYEQLDLTKFRQVHRTAIVNLDRVSSLNDKGESLLELESGNTVPVSKTHLPELRAALRTQA